jgi:hypothetical protein
MTADEAAVQRKGELLKKLAPIGQEHLLAFWDELTAVEREQLGRQIDEIDARLFRELQAEFRGHEAAGRDEKSKWADLAARAQSPRLCGWTAAGQAFPPTRPAPRGSGAQRRRGGHDPRSRGAGNAAGLRPSEGVVRAGPAVEAHAIPDPAGEPASGRPALRQIGAAVHHDQPRHRRGDAAVSGGARLVRLATEGSAHLLPGDDVGRRYPLRANPARVAQFTVPGSRRPRWDARRVGPHRLPGRCPAARAQAVFLRPDRQPAACRSATSCSWAATSWPAAK